MLGRFSLPFELPQWEYWVILIIGLASAGLALVTSTAVFRARRRRQPPPVRASQTTSDPSDPFIFGSATERREAARRPGRHVRALISDADAQAVPSQGWITDRSVGGLGLNLDREVAADTILSVRPLGSPDTIPWVQVRVLHCEGDKDHWQLGCEFLRVPPWNVMMHFG
jgi:hypothetical protein